MKKKKQSTASLKLKIEPPAETQPIMGGIVPINAPGTTAKALLFLRKVYIPLYATTPPSPRYAAKGPPLKRMSIRPTEMSTTDSRSAEATEVFPEGIGRLLVRSMRASISPSWHWFRALQPADRRKTPAVTAIRPALIPEEEKT
jgi:hypothetical protein